MGKLNSLERTIGLEFEFSNPRALADSDAEEIIKVVGPEWVRDGSLPESGKELVTSPLRGDQFIEGISTLVAMIKTLKPEVNRRCGYHVHIGAKDLNYHNVRNLIIAWCGIERDVFAKLCRPDRLSDPHTVRYCIPLRASSPHGKSGIPSKSWQMTKSALQELGNIQPMAEIEAWLFKRFYNAEPGSRELAAQIKNKRAAGEGTGCFRYSAMNLHSYWHRKTIEFRLKEGTLDEAECLYWPLFCGWFIENIAHMRLEDVKKITSLTAFLEVGKMPKRLKAWVLEKMANPPAALAAEPEIADIFIPAPPRFVPEAVENAAIDNAIADGARLGDRPGDIFNAPRPWAQVPLMRRRG